jgi:ABC-type sugar transport system permease subunit
MRVKNSKKPPPWRRNYGALIVFIAPFFVLLFLIKVLPIFMNAGYSLMKMDLVKTAGFAGFENYAVLFRDPHFYDVIRNTFQYLLYVGPVNIIAGFLMALLLNAKLRGGIIMRSAVFLPYILMITVVGITWRWLLDGRGLINQALSAFGFGPVYFLTQESTAMIGVAIASIWWTIGYNTIIYFAALQDIPRELMESAGIDGAGAFTRMMKITIPLVKNTTFFVVITTVIYSMQMFGQVYVMTAGGPNYSTLSFVQYLYLKGFKEFKLGYAAAIGVVLFVIILVLSGIIFLLFTDRDERGSKITAGVEGK